MYSICRWTPKVDRNNEEFLKKQHGKGWATDSESLSKQNELFKEDVEDMMPEFGLEDEDRKVHSF